ncbi:hypothetical protein MIB92_06725 [Aestuariirhabdus sp. Z084]|uniref:hypothetical protein n=1 Tax=Aestuariirhabdus haliotis TaxID=2918751 RepID=UPI00201B4362|nr:hypothetical protein [Aestuariirhabdus haliotis]MCL6415338.1 hypothetical protein [Aestuariirhabdus haliotis]MCL6419094.1 hypothetical protein [Aestuariirhabdus haliotis]
MEFRQWAVMAVMLVGLSCQLAYAEPEGDFELYSASSALDGQPVTLKLNTLSGNTWHFDGSAWLAMNETGSKNLYESPSYRLQLTDSSQGLVIFRFSVVNGSSWIYTSRGWEYIEEPGQ